MTATTEAPPIRPPRVSVVVPTRNRAQQLDRCLDALLRQTLAPVDYEVLIVDDGPSHQARQLVANWRARAAARGLALRYLVNTGAHGPAAARNMGWRLARAPVIAFTEDGSVPSPTWLRQGLVPFNHGADAVCGRVEMAAPAHPACHHREASRAEGGEFAAANCFVRKRVLDAIGGFDEKFRDAWHDDSDLYFRLLDARASIVRARHAMVFHAVRPAPWGISLVQMKKLASDALLYKKHPMRYRQHIRATPRWDYYAIAAALLLALGALAAGHIALAAVAGAAWLALTTLFCAHRLGGAPRKPSHVAGMVLTSALLPPLAVFWLVAGAIRCRVAFT